MPLPILHVGFPKAGSTTIQLNFFAKIPSALYVSRGSNGGRHIKLYNQLSHAAKSGTQLRPAAKAWGALIEAHSGAVIFADERITLPAISGRYLLERPIFLKKIFGNAKIILILREPLAHLRSLYQHVAIVRYQRAQTLPLPFHEWLETELVGAQYRPSSYAQALYFGDLAIRYQEVFGKKNLGLFFLEDLKINPGAFFERLARFMELGDLPAALFNENPVQNATAEKQTIFEIDKLLPGFTNPTYPEAFLKQARPLVETQSRLLREFVGIDPASRWDSHI